MGVFANTFNAIANAIKAKDGGGDMTPAQMAGRIAALPEWSWKKPEGWTDLKIVLENNKIQGKYAIAFLISNIFESCYIKTDNAVSFKFSDGTTSSGNTVTKTWTDGIPPSSTSTYSRWAIAYFNDNTANGLYLNGNSNVIWIEGDDSISLYNPYFRNEIGLVRVSIYGDITLNNTTFSFQSFTLEEVSARKIVCIGNCGRTFDSCNTLKKVPTTIDFTLATNTNGFFYFCYSLLNLPSNVTVSMNCTSMKQMFTGCCSIVELPNTLVCYGDCSLLFYSCSAIMKFPTVFDVSHATNVAEILPERAFCPNPPDVLDFSSVSSSSNIGNLWFNRYASSYRYLPTHITSYYDLKMNNINLLTNGFVRDSLATFSGGVITGGLVYNINSVSSTTTISLPSNIKTLFDSTEQSAIASAFTDKGWTLAW